MTTRNNGYYGGNFFEKKFPPFLLRYPKFFARYSLAEFRPRPLSRRRFIRPRRRGDELPLQETFLKKARKYFRADFFCDRLCVGMFPRTEMRHRRKEKAKHQERRQPRRERGTGGEKSLGRFRKSGSRRFSGKQEVPGRFCGIIACLLTSAFEMVLSPP